jgi:hypothetical protein
MKKRPSGEWAPSLPYTQKIFRPYALALGQMNMAWNDLHLSLCQLFCTLMGGGDIGKFLAIWSNIPQDRVQRDVLLAVAKLDHNVMRAPDNKLLKSIEWICSTTTAHEDYRNDIIHSPLMAHGIAKPAIVPVTGLRHKRAKKLLGRGDLLRNIRRHRDIYEAIRNFAVELDAAMSRTRVGPWPNIPQLPPTPATQAKSQPPQTRATKPARPPRSSQA